jgi:hypothetical protein
LSDSQEEKRKSVVGVAGFFLWIILWPASCEWRERSARQEAEAIARRAIERKYGATAQEAEELLQKQREWEGR